MLRRPLSVFYVLLSALLLSACLKTQPPEVPEVLPEVPVQEPKTPETPAQEPLEPRETEKFLQNLHLKVDPTFDIATIEDAETRAWYARVKDKIRVERGVSCSGAKPEGASATHEAACTGEREVVGRTLNMYVTSLLTLFRVTGDKELLDEVDRVMEVAYANLKDTDGDGYRAWTLRSLEALNRKEDSLAHGFIAQVAFTLKQNAEYSTPEHNYEAHADAWLAYLQDEFEAKWRRYKGNDFPEPRLMHPYINLVRYHLYMSKLFPEDARYVSELDRMSAIVLEEFVVDETPNGEAYVWSHELRQVTKGATADTCLNFQMSGYPPYTVQNFVDLGLAGHAGFAGEVALGRMARTVSEALLEPAVPNSQALKEDPRFRDPFLYKDVGGLRNGDLDEDTRLETRIGPDNWCFKEVYHHDGSTKSPAFRSTEFFFNRGYTSPGVWLIDSETPLEETEIYRTSREVYGDPSVSQPEKDVHVPAAMAFMRLYAAGNYTLGE